MKLTKCWILTLVFYYLLGLILFFRGYFIDRRYLLDQTQGESKSTQPVILLIIDSFRIDLAVNQYFTFFKNMTQHHPDQSLFFLSFAEVPTVTGPRLQAMTSGNFPPLSKLLDNFHASEIVEDNIMFQMKKFGRKTLFSGDNTWMGLYPNIFTEEYPKESFNIGDMHTVDEFNSDMITKNLDQGFDLIVSHFLGLDHAGHRNNKVHNNTDLDQKLKQIDKIAYNIYEKMANDTILIIAGDHGMADDGNHGGNSTEETNTVFFAVRKQGIFYPKYMDNIQELKDNYISTLADRSEYIRKISQIDIVPTLAHLLGIPIPYSNLGYLMNEFFNSEEYCLDNLKQVWTFVEAVHKAHSKFTYYSMNLWKNKLQDVKNCKDALILMNDIQLEARKIWNEYDIPLLQLAFILQFFTLILFILVLIGLYYSTNTEEIISKQQITATMKHLLARNKKISIVSSLLIAILFIFYEIEIVIAIVSILSIIIVDFLLIIKIRKDYLSYQTERRRNLTENPEDIGFVEISNDFTTDQTSSNLEPHECVKHFCHFIQISILIIFLYKVLQQGYLLLSIKEKKNEEKYLFNQLNELLLLGTILSLLNVIYRMFNKKQGCQFQKNILDGCFSLASFGVIYLALRYEEFYLLQLDFWHLSEKIYQYYLPALFLHICLLLYQREKCIIDNFIAQFGLLLIDIFFILPLTTDFKTSNYQEFVTLNIPKIIYLISFYYFYSKDIIFIFLSCLVVSDVYGIAIYSYEIAIFIFLVVQWKHLLKYSQMAFFAFMSLVCQFTWFIFGNRCTISSIKLDRAYVGFPKFNLFVNPIILTLFLVGPYLAGLVFIKYIQPQLAKYSSFSKNQSQNALNLFKLMFMFNFALQIEFTQIHSYMNAGGLIDVQFKYIFDSVTFVVVSLLMLLF